MQAEWEEGKYVEEVSPCWLTGRATPYLPRKECVCETDDLDPVKPCCVVNAFCSVSWAFSITRARSWRSQEPKSGCSSRHLLPGGG